MRRDAASLIRCLLEQPSSQQAGLGSAAIWRQRDRLPRRRATRAGRLRRRISPPVDGDDQPGAPTHRRCAQHGVRDRHRHRTSPALDTNAPVTLLLASPQRRLASTPVTRFASPSPAAPISSKATSATGTSTSTSRSPLTSPATPSTTGRRPISRSIRFEPGRSSHSPSYDEAYCVLRGAPPSLRARVAVADCARTVNRCVGTRPAQGWLASLTS